MLVNQHFLRISRSLFADKEGASRMFSSSDAQGERARLLPASSPVQNNRSQCFTACAACADCAVEKNEDDDVVSLGVKRLCVLFSIVIGFWLLSFLLIMSDVIQHEEITAQAIFHFLPMWYGSAVGIISVVMVSVHVCGNATLISKERRQFLRRQGTEAQSLFIDYDSLPLMRRLFCWNIGLTITFLLVLTAQILFTLWFIYGIIGLWHALIPMILLTVGYLGYLYLMNFFSVLCCSCATLAVFQLVLFTLKCNGELPGVSWTIATIPMDIVIIASCVYLFKVCYEGVRGRYCLKRAQQFSLVGYILSLTLFAIAVGITVYREFLHNVIWTGTFNNPAAGTVIGTVQYVLCTIAVAISTLCIIVILNMEGRTLAHTRGFRNPIPLSRYKDGWLPTSGCGDVYAILLGSIETKAASPAQISSASLLAPRSSVDSTRSGGSGGGTWGTYGRLSPIDAIVQAQQGPGMLSTGSAAGAGAGGGAGAGAGGRKGRHNKATAAREQREWEEEIELLVRKASPVYDSSAV